MERGGVVPGSAARRFVVVVLAWWVAGALFRFKKVHSVNLQTHWVFALAMAVVGEDVADVVFDGFLREAWEG